ncbi:unnamed protein product [Didymodactylos carnosus]|uniref:Uncharacterized protein n=1 Tax=Didymodactylos carnosus TaxID=1234261 RepID=A0A814GSH7_9BILA|nr:unnamed protein product [Didymodactylos carnosus]CAF3772086.1 unnamed protein product [Didymodactylos carnosus]
MLSPPNTYLPGHISLITQPSLARSRNRNSTIIIDDHISSSRRNSSDNNTSCSSPLSITHSVTKKSHESTDSGLDLSFSTSSSQHKLLQETNTQLNNNSNNTDAFRQNRPSIRPLSALSEESEFIQSGRQLLNPRKHRSQSDDEDDQGYDDKYRLENTHSEIRTSSVDRHLNKVSPAPSVRLRQKPFFPPIILTKELQSRSSSFSNTEVNAIDKTTINTKLSKKLKRASDGALLDIVSREEIHSSSSYGNTKSLEQLNESPIPPRRRLSNKSEENSLLSLTNNNKNNRVDNRLLLNDMINELPNNHLLVKPSLFIKNETNVAATSQFVTNIDHQHPSHVKKPTVLKPLKKKKIVPAIAEPYNRDTTASRIDIYHHHHQDHPSSASNTTMPRTTTNKIKFLLETPTLPESKQTGFKLNPQKSQTVMDFQEKTMDQRGAHENRSVIDRSDTFEQQQFLPKHLYRPIQKEQVLKSNTNNTFQQFLPFNTLTSKKTTPNHQRGSDQKRSNGEMSTGENELISTIKASQKKKALQEQKRMNDRDEEEIIEDFSHQQSHYKTVPQVYRPQAFGYFITEENLNQLMVYDEEDENYDSDDGWSVSSVDIRVVASASDSSALIRRFNVS